MSIKATAKNSNDPIEKRATKRHPGQKTKRRGARISGADQHGQLAGEDPKTVRKRPRQQRSKEMVEAIMQAAAEIFAQLGYARATTNKIAHRAGVSVGSLYQYFPNKDSLLVSLMDQHHGDVDVVVDRALTRLADPAHSVEHCLRQLLAELVAVHQANPDLTRALSPDVLRQSPATDALHKAEPDASLSMRVVATLAARPDIRDGDHFAMAAVLGQTISQLTRWLVHSPPPGVDPDTLAEEILQLLVRYLKPDLC
jgi:AcrR family transcriptional regulator